MTGSGGGGRSKEHGNAQVPPAAITALAWLFVAVILGLCAATWTFILVRVAQELWP